MMMEIAKLCEEYCARLREKVQLLDHFGGLTGKIKEALEAQDAKGLTLCLKERQGVIDKVKRIDKEVERLVGGNGFSMEKLSDKTRSLISGYLNQIRTALESLAVIDKECVLLAQAEHKSMKSEILKVRDGLRVAKGYRDTCPRNPKFLDTKR